MGKGAVRSVVSGAMTITNDITASQPPAYEARYSPIA
jgi:hypothetical protein